MSATTYTSPVDKLLTLGEAEFVLPEKWPDYLELGLGPEHIPELIRMATDRELRNIEAEEDEEEDPEFWAPIHTIRALGQLHAEAAIEPLAACRRERSSGRVGCFVSACVLHGTGGSDSMEHGRRQKTVGDRERAGCTHVVAPALHSR